MVHLNLAWRALVGSDQRCWLRERMFQACNSSSCLVVRLTESSLSCVLENSQIWRLRRSSRLSRPHPWWHGRTLTERTQERTLDFQACQCNQAEGCSSAKQYSPAIPSFQYKSATQWIGLTYRCRVTPGADRWSSWIRGRHILMRLLLYSSWSSYLNGPVTREATQFQIHSRMLTVTAESFLSPICCEEARFAASFVLSISSLVSTSKFCWLSWRSCISSRGPPVTNLISESSWPSWLSRVIQFQSHLLTQQILNSLILEEASDFDLN